MGGSGSRCPNRCGVTPCLCYGCTHPACRAEQARVHTQRIQSENRERERRERQERERRERERLEWERQERERLERERQERERLEREKREREERELQEIENVMPSHFYQQTVVISERYTDSKNTIKKRLMDHNSDYVYDVSDNDIISTVTKGKNVPVQEIGKKLCETLDEQELFQSTSSLKEYAQNGFILISEEVIESLEYFFENYKHRDFAYDNVIDTLEYICIPSMEFATNTTIQERLAHFLVKFSDHDLREIICWSFIKLIDKANAILSDQTIEIIAKHLKYETDLDIKLSLVKVIEKLIANGKQVSENVLDIMSHLTQYNDKTIVEQSVCLLLEASKKFALNEFAWRAITSVAINSFIETETRIKAVISIINGCENNFIPKSLLNDIKTSLELKLEESLLSDNIVFYLIDSICLMKQLVNENLSTKSLNIIKNRVMNDKSNTIPQRVFEILEYTLNTNLQRAQLIDILAFIKVCIEKEQRIPQTILIIVNDKIPEELIDNSSLVIYRHSARLNILTSDIQNTLMQKLKNSLMRNQWQTASNILEIFYELIDTTSPINHVNLLHNLINSLFQCLNKKPKLSEDICILGESVNFTEVNQQIDQIVNQVNRYSCDIIGANFFINEKILEDAKENFSTGFVELINNFLRVLEKYIHYNVPLPGELIWFVWVLITIEEYPEQMRTNASRILDLAIYQNMFPIGLYEDIQNNIKANDTILQSLSQRITSNLFEKGFFPSLKTIDCIKNSENITDKYLLSIIFQSLVHDLQVINFEVFQIFFRNYCDNNYTIACDLSFEHCRQYLENLIDSIDKANNFDQELQNKLDFTYIWIDSFNNKDTLVPNLKIVNFLFNISCGKFSPNEQMPKNSKENCENIINTYLENSTDSNISIVAIRAIYENESNSQMSLNIYSTIKSIVENKYSTEYELCCYAYLILCNIIDKKEEIMEISKQLLNNISGVKISSTFFSALVDKVETDCLVKDCQLKSNISQLLQQIVLDSENNLKIRQAAISTIIYLSTAFKCVLTDNLVEDFEKIIYHESLNDYLNYIYFWCVIHKIHLTSNAVQHLEREIKTLQNTSDILNVNENLLYACFAIGLNNEKFSVDIQLILDSLFYDFDGSCITTYVNYNTNEAYKTLLKLADNFDLDKKLKVSVGIIEALVLKNKCDEALSRSNNLLLENTEYTDCERSYIMSHLGESLRKIGNLSEAQKWLNKAISIDPNNKWILTRLGLTSLQLLQFRDAIKYIQRLPTKRLKPINDIIKKCIQLKKKLVDHSYEEIIVENQLRVIVNCIGKCSNEKIIQFLDFMLKLNVKVELNLNENSPIENWYLDIMKIIIMTTSEFILSESELNITIEDVLQFDEYWYSFAFYHNLYKQTDEQILDSLIFLSEIQSNFKLSLSQINELLILFHINSSILSLTIQLFDDIESFKLELRNLWLIQNISEADLTRDMSEKLWKLFDEQSFGSDYSKVKQFLDNALSLKLSSNNIQSLLELANNFKITSDQLLSVIKQIETENRSCDYVFELKSYLIRRLLNETFANIESNNNNSNNLELIRNSINNAFVQNPAIFDEYLTQMIEKLSTELKASENFDDLLHNFLLAFNIIYRYKINNMPINEWPLNLHKNSISYYFSNASHERDVHSFLNEIRSMNSNKNENVLASLDSIEIALEKMRSSYESTSQLLAECESNIEDYDRDNIKCWAQKLKENIELANDMSFMPEIIAVIVRSVYILFDYKPRNSQIISLLFLLKGQQNLGRLARITTGEGKSLIVSMLAAVKALQANYVDIVTSSPVLAQRDANEFKTFYDMFGLTVMDNYGDQENEGIPKICYACNIVYGTSTMFEADILRHEYSLTQARGDRQFNVVIVDEVDSMLIDQSGHSTKLVDKMPAMDFLEPALTILWSRLNNFLESLLKINGEFYALTETGVKIDNFLGCIFQILPEDTKRDNNISDENELKELFKQFSHKVISDTISDETAVQNIVQIIKNDFISICESQKLLEILESVENFDEIDKNHPIINEFVKENWSLESNGNLLKIVALLFKLEIIVYEINENGEMLPSHQFLYNNQTTCSTTVKLLLGNHNLYKMDEISDLDNYCNDLIESDVKRYLHLNSEEQGENKLKVPKHLIEYINRKLKLWIKSATTAKLTLEENRDYVIKQDYSRLQKITPVDFQSTGVTQDNTLWSNGLHQFLQMKHKLSLSPETVTSNFLSNMVFYRRYGSQIYGLTGTLGSENEVHLLQHIYGVDTIEIPTFKEKKLIYLSDTICNNKSDWLQTILLNITLESNNGRAVLVICKTIKDVYIIQSKLKNYIKQNEFDIEVILYTRSDTDEQNSIKSKINSRTIILATNLAGRGTDIKLTDDVIKCGGLHVCITFLPTNVRVEDQAAGRCARQDDGYKEDAIKCLQKSIEIIHANHITSLTVTQQLIEGREANKASECDSDLTKQIASKVGFYKLMVKNIEESFENINKHKEVIAKYKTIDDYCKEIGDDGLMLKVSAENRKTEGFVGFLQIEKKPPPPWQWLNILGVFLLGVLQVVVGAVLVVCTLGAASSVGSGLIGEGIGDIVTGIEAAVSGEFSWIDYLKNKAMSIVASIAAGPVGKAFSYVGNVVKVGVKYIGKAITTVATKFANTAVGKLAVSGFTAIKTTLSTVTNFLYNSGVKIKSNIMNMYNNSKAWIINKLNSAKNWIAAKYEKIANFTVDKYKRFGVQKAWTTTKDFVNNAANKLTSGLSQSQRETLKLMGRSVANKAVEKGIGLALHYTYEALKPDIIEPIINAIRRDLKAKIKNQLNNELNNSQIGSKLSEILNKLSTGEQKIMEIAQEIFEKQDSKIVQMVYKVAVEVSSSCAKEFRKNLARQKPTGSGSKSILIKIATETALLLMENIDVIRAINDSVMLVSKFITNLESQVDKLIENSATEDVNMTRDKICEIKQSFCEDWSEKLSTKVMDIVVDKIVEPKIVEESFNAFVDKITFSQNKKFDEDLIKYKAKNIPLKRLMNTPQDSYLNKAENVINKLYLFKESNASEDEISLVNQQIENLKSNGFGDISHIPGIAVSLNKQIELYCEDKNGNIVKYNTYGSEDNSEPIRVLQQTNGEFRPVLSLDNKAKIAINFDEIGELVKPENSLFASVIVSSKKQLTNEAITDLRDNIVNHTISRNNDYAKYYGRYLPIIRVNPIQANISTMRDNNANFTDNSNNEVLNGIGRETDLRNDEISDINEQGSEVNKSENFEENIDRDSEINQRVELDVESGNTDSHVNDNELKLEEFKVNENELELTEFEVNDNEIDTDEN